MDEEMLRKILKEELKPIHSDIKEMKTDIKDIKQTLQEIESINANRHVEMTDELKQTNIKLDELKELKQVTKENCYDIAKLKAVK